MVLAAQARHFGRAGATSLILIPDRDVEVPRHAGFEETYLTYRSAIYGHVLRMMADETDAEDITVAAFEKALRAWERRPPDHEMRPWLFRIATNACLDELRKRKRVQWHPWDAFIGLFHPAQVAPDDPEREAIRNEKAELLKAALATLSPRDRAALLMRECNGLSNEEVGKALNTTRDGAKMLLFRAREKLRIAYLRMGGDPPETGRWAGVGSAKSAQVASTEGEDPILGEAG